MNETWLDHNTDSEDLINQGFQEPMRRDRGDNRYGGVMIYVNSNIVCKRRTDLEVTQVECIWVECIIYKKKFLIGTFYRRPNSETEKWNLIAYSMEKAKDTNISNIIITGDFNDNLNNLRTSKINDIIKDLGMTQLITDPTHFTENSETLLDLLIVNNIENIVFSGVGDNILPSNTGYHCPIYCVLKSPKLYVELSLEMFGHFRKPTFMIIKFAYINKIWICKSLMKSIKLVTKLQIRY